MPEALKQRADRREGWGNRSTCPGRRQVRHPLEGTAGGGRTAATPGPRLHVAWQQRRARCGGRGRVRPSRSPRAVETAGPAARSPPPGSRLRGAGEASSPGRWTTLAREGEGEHHAGGQPGEPPAGPGVGGTQGVRSPHLFSYELSVACGSVRFGAVRLEPPENTKSTRKTSAGPGGAFGGSRAGFHTCALEAFCCPTSDLRNRPATVARVSFNCSILLSCFKK